MSFLKIFKPFDIFILILVATPFFFQHHKTSLVPDNVHIKLKNTNYYYPLNSDTALVYHSFYDTVVVQIQDKKVWVSETHCPLKLCQKQGKIGQVGQQIIGVPNRILIEIEGKEPKKYGAISQVRKYAGSGAGKYDAISR